MGNRSGLDDAPENSDAKAKTSAAGVEFRNLVEKKSNLYDAPDGQTVQNKTKVQGQTPNTINQTRTDKTSTEQPESGLHFENIDQYHNFNSNRFSSNNKTMERLYAAQNAITNDQRNAFKRPIQLAAFGPAIEDPFHDAYPVPIIAE